jgi:ABC-type lipoprotein release transport system permease subunit
MKSLLEKQRNILDFALSSLLRRWGRNLALLAVYSGIVFFLGSVMFFTNALKQEAALLLASTPEVIVQKIVAGRHDLIPLDYAEKIRKIRGVAEVQGRLWGYYYDPVSRANYTLISAPGLGLEDQNIIIGEGISRVLNVGKGRTIRLRSIAGRFINFKVKGVLSSESALVSTDLMLMAEDDFRKLFAIPAGVATDLTVMVRNKKEISTVATKIAEIFPDSRPITKNEVLRTYDAVFDWRGGIILVILTGAVLAFVIFAWEKATGLSAEEKREIGILKGIGWDTADVLQLKFWEGLSISLTSFLLGVILAYGHVFLVDAPLFAPVLKGWSVLYPSFHLTPFISLYEIVILFFFTVIPYTVATIVPAWKAATMDPDQVMRS